MLYSQTKMYRLYRKMTIQKYIDYTEKISFMFIVLYNLFIFVLIKHGCGHFLYNLYIFVWMQYFLESSFNLYHSLGKFRRWQTDEQTGFDISWKFLIFFSGNRLWHFMQIVSYFLGKVKIFQNVIEWFFLLSMLSIKLSSIQNHTIMSSALLA